MFSARSLALLYLESRVNRTRCAERIRGASEPLAGAFYNMLENNEMQFARLTWFAVLVLTAATAQTVSAEQLKVKGVITQWQPLVLFAQPGDTVTFTNMAGHDTASIEGMIPEGAEAWQSKMGEEAFTITVEKEGAYIYKCTPHMSTGMVGAIVVGDGDPANLEVIEAELPDVKVGRNMVNRTIKKMKKALEKRAAG